MTLLKLNPNYDIELDASGRALVTEGSASVVQALQEIFRLWKGTWSIRQNLGIDYFTALFGSLDTRLLEQAIKNELLQRSYLNAVLRIEVQANQNRLANVDIEVETIEGETLQTQIDV